MHVTLPVLIISAYLTKEILVQLKMPHRKYCNNFVCVAVKLCCFSGGAALVHKDPLYSGDHVIVNLL